MNQPKPLVLWDRDCGLCARWAAWMERRDRGRRLQLAPYQSAPITEEMRARCEGAMHVLMPDGRLLRAGRAALFAFGEVGFRPITSLLALPPFIWFVELGYKTVARNRRRISRVIFGEKNPTCRM